MEVPWWGKRFLCAFCMTVRCCFAFCAALLDCHEMLLSHEQDQEVAFFWRYGVCQKLEWRHAWWIYITSFDARGVCVWLTLHCWEYILVLCVYFLRWRSSWGVLGNVVVLSSKLPHQWQAPEPQLHWPEPRLGWTRPTSRVKSFGQPLGAFKQWASGRGHPWPKGADVHDRGRFH